LILIEAHTFTFGLIGHPLGHSYSPVLQQAALDSVHLPGNYYLYEIEPSSFDAKIQILLNEIRSGSRQGLNVTIPYKEKIIPYMDCLTPAAQDIGAVNTIYIENEFLVGHNTDAPGLLTDLGQKGLLDPPGVALIIGAGGAARGAAYALLTSGWQVTLAARRLQPAQQIQADLSRMSSSTSIQIETLASEALQPRLPDFHLVINATPVGMAPQTEASPWPHHLPFPPRAALYDMIYNPAVTRLMVNAKASGCQRVYNGLGMLIQQAALAFECWTGQKPLIPTMQDQILSYLDTAKS
jgi:shikimate dehydrogenase